MRAYVYGSEVEIVDYHLTKRTGTLYCRVRILENGWLENVPASVIDIR